MTGIVNMRKLKHEKEVTVSKPTEPKDVEIGPNHAFYALRLRGLGEWREGRELEATFFSYQKLINLTFAYVLQLVGTEDENFIGNKYADTSSEKLLMELAKMATLNSFLGSVRRRSNSKPRYPLLSSQHFSEVSIVKPSVTHGTMWHRPKRARR